MAPAVIFEGRLRCDATYDQKFTFHGLLVSLIQCHMSRVGTMRGKNYHDFYYTTFILHSMMNDLGVAVNPLLTNIPSQGVTHFYEVVGFRKMKKRRVNASHA